MPSITRPPGPKGHFLLGVLPEIREEDVKYATRLAREYGDVVFMRVVNIPTYLISHPRCIEEVLVTNYRNFIKAVYLRESRALFGEGLLTSDGDTWVPSAASASGSSATSTSIPAPGPSWASPSASWSNGTTARPATFTRK